MILTQQILNDLILEALTDMEAECLAQMAPIHNISKEFRGRDGIRLLASILKARADQSGKSWEDYLRDWKESVESEYGGTDLRSDALEDCLRKKKAKQSFGSSPRVRPGGAGDAADATFAVGLSEQRLRKIIVEELTKTDKSEIKKMIADEIDKKLKPELKKILQDELIKELGSTKTKKEVGEIAKKVIKKLYKDLSFHHPYIIDRIKV